MHHTAWLLQTFRSLMGDRKELVELSLLNNLTGVIKPGRLTLLLGPPSCGKTTFLKVLGEWP
jgi:ABC-type multidrug transport system ATPase subunit